MTELKTLVSGGKERNNYKDWGLSIFVQKWLRETGEQSRTTAHEEKGQRVGKELQLLEVDRPVGYDILEAEQTREGECSQ